MGVSLTLLSALVFLLGKSKIEILIQYNEVVCYVSGYVLKCKIALYTGLHVVRHLK